ncbi:MAG: ribosome maturation factor RimM [Thermonemataceae bacterium]|nr:ribosome maturation factor RimM [Thermonemataceae bacterium]
MEEEKISREDCYELGKILKPHGLKGEVSVFLDVDSPEEYEQMDSVIVELEGELIGFEVEKVRILPNKPKVALLKLADIDSIEDTEELIGANLLLPLDVLPSLDDTHFYFHEIIGFEIVDAKKGLLDKVETVYSFAEGSLLVMMYQGKEVLIPINDETITNVDRKAKRLHVNLPEGLLEVYL